MTQIRGKEQIQANTVVKGNMNIADTGDAVITKVIAGTNIGISETGADAGTGEVTINNTGASKELDNLGTTAVNADIKPDTDMSYMLGYNNKFWYGAWLGKISLKLQASVSSPSSGNRLIWAGTDGKLHTQEYGGSDQILSINTNDLTWEEVTDTTKAMSINRGYLVNNTELVSLTLPVTAALFSTIRIVGKGIGGWKILQNDGQVIHFGIYDTTIGAVGYLASAEDRNCIELLCVVANDEWEVISHVGNIALDEMLFS